MYVSNEHGSEGILVHVSLEHVLGGKKCPNTFDNKFM